MPFPTHRPRRLRTTPALRRLVAETDLRPRHLVLPMFVKEGAAEPVPIASMPGVVQHTRDSLRKAAVEAVEAGRRRADAVRRAAAARRPRLRGVDPDGVLNVALADVRAEVGDATVLMADTCLDEFTDHGHCGVLDARRARGQRRDPRPSTPRWRSPRPRPGRTCSAPAG